MKSFFKNVLSTIVGVIFSCIILGFIAVFVIMGVVGVALSSNSKLVSIEENSVLALNMEGVMKDRTAEDPFFEYLGLNEVKELSLTDIISAIKKAKDNKNISGIYIRSGYLSASSASLEEIRNQLIDFKKSGKFVVAYADNYLQGGYYLSSVADQVIMNPQGVLDLHGLSAQYTFYKGLFEKVGVDIQVFKVGTYKSVVEPYISNQMSEANKEQVSSYTNSIWSVILDGISEERNITTDRLNQISDSLAGFQGSQYILDNKLVDALLYETEAKAYLKKRVGINEYADLNLVSVSDIISMPDINKHTSKEKIAILYAEGSIVSGTSNKDINDRYLVKQITKLQNDDNVKAVVFRVSSPGGSAYASEQIWKAITDLKEKKPVVVSMGSYAASGGYYISCNADKIFAEPTTITGSIGIFGMFPNVEGLTNKIGLTFDNVNTNKLSDFGDITRPMTSEEQAILQRYIDRGYDLFLTRCAEGRGMSKEEINTVAQGRVWTGLQAVEIGLVDALGGIDDAVLEAAKLAEITDYSLTEHPQKVGRFESILNISKEEIADRAIKGYLGEDFHILKTIKDIKELKEQDFIQARIPYEVQIK